MQMAADAIAVNADGATTTKYVYDASMVVSGSGLIYQGMLHAGKVVSEACSVSFGIRAV